MSELQSVQRLLEEAKHAAEAGDLGSADVLLRDAAHIQESELGPLHPELADTMNNLAVVAEVEGRLGDAETYYRRSVAIASASLPADDPRVASSRKNLEDFCRERGLPLDASAAAPAVEPTEQRRDPVAGRQTTRGEKSAAYVEAVNADVGLQAPLSAAETRPARDSATHVPDGASATVAPATRPFVMVAIGVVALIVVALLFARPWSARQSPTQSQPSDSVAPQAAEPALPRPAAPAPAPVEQPRPPAAASRDEKPGVTAATPPSRGRASANITLVTSQLCRTLSVGNNWRCDPAGQTVAPGPIVLYTRVKSSRDGVVIHRWYRGDTLRKSARLTILANSTDGYRTFSRQTVKSGEEWRVEVRDTSDELLYEQRVSVR